MKSHMTPRHSDHRLEPYGAPVALLSADPSLLELVDLAFAEHAPLTWVTTEQQLLDLLLTDDVAAVILDGTIAEPAEVCLRLRLASPAPLLVIAEGVDADGRVRLLRAGADDVLARPCWPVELRARVIAKLRRVAWETNAPDAPALRVELRLLALLEHAAGRFVSPATMRQACPEERLQATRLDHYLGDLAVRLDRLGLAQLERGGHAGYRLVWPVAAPAAVA